MNPEKTKISVSDQKTMAKDVCECLYIWGCSKNVAINVLNEALNQIMDAKWKQSK